MSVNATPQDAQTSIRRIPKSYNLKAAGAMPKNDGYITVLESIKKRLQQDYESEYKKTFRPLLRSRDIRILRGKRNEHLLIQSVSMARKKIPNSRRRKSI